MGEIAGALRGAAGEYDQVAGGERAAHRALERGLVVRERPERHRLAAGFRYGRRDDRAVAVEDPPGPEHAAGRHELVAGRKHCDLRPADHLDR